MYSVLRVTLLASALVLSAVPSVLPAQAQSYYGDVSFDSFYDQLAQYGNWLYSDRWGMVWQPGDVPDDFRPYYTDGRWVYTENFGWMWLSDYEWGDIPFHYGRWINDPDDGWLWIPGYIWSPGWVLWRSNGDYVGWMPTPPDEAFLQGDGDVSVGMSFEFGRGSISFNWNDPYDGYRRWYGGDYDDRRFASNWVFIGEGHMADWDYRREAVHDPVRVVNIIHNTQNITNYTVINNYVVNRSVDVHMVERASGRPIEAVQARTVIRRPDFMTTVDMGQRVRMQARATAPVGLGFANSAPVPSRRVIERLSDVATPHSGHAPAHLFTRTTVTDPNVLDRFHGMPSGYGREPGPMPRNGGQIAQPYNVTRGHIEHGPNVSVSSPYGNSVPSNQPVPTAMFHREWNNGRGPQDSGSMTAPYGNTPSSNQQAPTTFHRDQSYSRGSEVSGSTTNPSSGVTPNNPPRPIGAYRRDWNTGPDTRTSGAMTGPYGGAPPNDRPPPTMFHRDQSYSRGSEVSGPMTGPFGGVTPNNPPRPIGTFHRDQRPGYNPEASGPMVKPYSASSKDKAEKRKADHPND